MTRVKVKLLPLQEDKKISVKEMETAIELSKQVDDKFAINRNSRQNAGGFAHIGAMGQFGRESYTKLSAIFGGENRYPASHCGISVLGIKGICGEKIIRYGS